MVILLCLGLYFLFPAFGTWKDVREEKAQPWELTAQVEGSTSLLESLVEIDGIDRISPILTFDAEIQSGEATLNTSVRAVIASYLDINLVSGSMFPESSNMPYLVLNEAASKAFTLDRDTNTTVSVGTSVTMTVDGTTVKASICGIYRDSSETPEVCMNYECAERLFSGTAGTMLAFALTGKGEAANVVSALNRKGIYPTFDQNEALRWEMMGKQAILYGLVSLALCCCAGLLLQNRLTLESEQWQRESQALLLSGMNQTEVSRIIPLRLLSMLILCLLAATVFAALTRNM